MHSSLSFVGCFVETQQNLFGLTSSYLYKITTWFDLCRSSSEKVLFLKLATVSITILNFMRCGFSFVFVKCIRV